MRTAEQRAPRGAVGALLALVALLLVAWLVARTQPPGMTITPARAAPGHTVSLRLLTEQDPSSALLFERDGRRLLLRDGLVSEVALPARRPSTTPCTGSS